MLSFETSLWGKHRESYFADDIKVRHYDSLLIVVGHRAKRMRWSGPDMHVV